MTEFDLRDCAPAIIVLFAVLAMGAGGCTSGESSRSDDGAAPAQSGTPDGAIGIDADAAPEDFSMFFGEGGGISGRWDGYAIRSDGAVLTWSGPTADEESSRIGSLSAEEMNDLWIRIQDADFFERNNSETGNLTAFMEITARDQTHRVSWIPGAEGFEPPVSEIDALYRHALQVAGDAAQ